MPPQERFSRKRKTFLFFSHFQRPPPPLFRSVIYSPIIPGKIAEIDILANRTDYESVEFHSATIYTPLLNHLRDNILANTIFFFFQTPPVTPAREEAYRGFYIHFHIQSIEYSINYRKYWQR